MITTHPQRFVGWNTLREISSFNFWRVRQWGFPWKAREWEHPSSPLRTLHLLLFPLTNYLSLLSSFPSPIVTSVYCFCPFISLLRLEQKKKKRRDKEIALELLSLFSLSQIFLGLYSWRQTGGSFNVWPLKQSWKTNYFQNVMFKVIGSVNDLPHWIEKNTLFSA